MTLPFVVIERHSVRHDEFFVFEFTTVLRARRICGGGARELRATRRQKKRRTRSVSRRPRKQTLRCFFFFLQKTLKKSISFLFPFACRRVRPLRIRIPPSDACPTFFFLSAFFDSAADARSPRTGHFYTAGAARGFNTNRVFNRNN